MFKPHITPTYILADEPQDNTHTHTHPSQMFEGGFGVRLVSNKELSCPEVFMT